MRFRDCLLLSVVSVSVAGCATGDFCKLADPHYFSERTWEVMTDEEISQELKHNELGERLCSWKPARR